MSSHVDPKVNDQFYKWLQWKYGKHKAVTKHRGKKHNYLGTNYIFHDGYLEIDTKDYVKDMLESFPIKFGPDTKCSNPAKGTLFEIGNTKLLKKEKAELFHTMVAKGLYVCKRGRLDIQPVIAVLCTQVQNPTQHDWDALVQMMKFLYVTQNDTRKIDTKQSIAIQHWMIDASFAVHPDFKSHTGAVNTGGNLFFSTV